MGTSPLRLSNGDYLEIPVADVFADGERLEAKGVQPDLMIEREFDVTGKDLDLDAALNHLKEVPTYQGSGVQKTY